MNLNQAKPTNLRSYNLLLSLFIVFIFSGCSSEPEVTNTFKPSSSVDPNTSLDCSGIWEGSPLCLERNQSLVELKKLDNLYQELILVKSPESEMVIDKVKTLRSEGDKNYNDEFYFKARDLYKEAFEAIIYFNSKNKTKVKNLILQSENLLAIGKPEEADKLIKEALSIEPFNSSILTLQKRVDNYYQISSLISASKKSLIEEDFDNALIKINEAILLDNLRLDSAELKDKIISESNEYYFDQYIRNSYKNIDSGDIKRALLNLSKAKKIYPNNEEIIILEKTLSKSKKQYDLTNFKKAGDLSYSNEDWSKALKNYSSALKLTPNDQLLKDQVSKVTNIEKIYDQLTKFISAPGRLSSTNIRNNLNTVLNTAKELNLVNEDNLINLIKKSDELFNSYSVMIVLNITSNNKTFIDIQKTAQYRPFESESIKLYPGKYTLIAKRKGMQSVRKEVNLTPESKIVFVTAICENQCRIFDSKSDESYENKVSSNKKSDTVSESINSSQNLITKTNQADFIKGAKINSTTFSRNLVCDKKTKNNAFRANFVLSVTNSGTVVSTRLTSTSITNLSTDDRKVIVIIERALKKSKFKLPKIDGKTSSGKINYPVSIPKNFCEL